jgi:hypothetical protein
MARMVKRESARLGGQGEGLSYGATVGEHGDAFARMVECDAAHGRSDTVREEVAVLSSRYDVPPLLEFHALHQRTTRRSVLLVGTLPIPEVDLTQTCLSRDRDA